jgi:REP element-mobilizing transposase RayT
MVFPVKYRREAISIEVEETIVELGKDISDRYEIYFVEIGADDNHIHFLIQSVPILSVEVIVRTIKSIMAKEIFKRHPEVKQKLWGGNFWTSGYYANTVGHYGNEEVIKKYIKEQGTEKEYKQLYRGQLKLFDV